MDGWQVTVFDSGGYVQRFVPKHEFAPSQVAHYYKTVNIYKLSCTFSRQCFLLQLHEHLASVGLHVYYEEVFGRIVSQQLAPIKAIIVDGMCWYEIDTAEDLQIAERLFSA